MRPYVAPWIRAHDLIPAATGRQTTKILVFFSQRSDPYRLSLGTSVDEIFRRHELTFRSSVVPLRRAWREGGEKDLETRTKNLASRIENRATQRLLGPDVLASLSQRLLGCPTVPTNGRSPSRGALFLVTGFVCLDEDIVGAVTKIPIRSKYPSTT